MKKLIAGVVAAVFLFGGAALAGGPNAQGLWQGTQTQNYDSYNFQGNTASKTTTFSYTTDKAFTKYDSNGINNATGVFDVSTLKAASVNTVETSGKLQNQGLTMGQSGGQVSTATPTWGVVGAVVGAAGDAEFLTPDPSWIVIGAAIGAAGNTAGANGTQNQSIAAANAQLNGNLDLNVTKEVSTDFGFKKDDVEFSGVKTTGSYEKEGWAVGGLVVGAAGDVQTTMSGVEGWGVAGVIGGLAYEKEGNFKLVSNAYDIEHVNVQGYSNSESELKIKGSIDFQYQDGAGTANQTSNTCAGISCFQ